MEVRRRTADTVKSSDTEQRERSDETVSPDIQQVESHDKDWVDPLLDKGKKLYNKAEESGFQEVGELIESLKCFVEAAGNGSREATRHLTTFFDSNVKTLTNIVEQLPGDLVAMAHALMMGTETEKQIYTVAKEMFETMAKERKVIPKDQLEEAAQRLLNTEIVVVGVEEIECIDGLKRSVKKLLNCAITTNEKGEEVVTEEAFCIVACRYARGEPILLPLEVESVSELSPEQIKEFKQSNWIKKATDFPKQTVQYVGQYGLRVIEKHGVRWIWSFFSLRQFYLLMLVYILPLINIGFVLSTLATFVFVGALLAMVISTLQIIANSTKVSSFMEYSLIFRYFSKHGKAINTSEPEALLIKRSAMPYATFSIATLLTVFTIGIAHQQIMIYELLVVITGGLAFVVFFHFQCWKSPLILITLSTRTLSWMLVILYLLQTWLPIPDFWFFVGWQIVKVPIFPGIYLDFNLTTLIQVPLQIILIVYLVGKYSWKNFFFGLGTYFLFVSWWIFCRYLFSHTSMLSLAIFFPCVAAVFIFLPILPLLVLVGPLFVMLYYGFSIQFLIALSTLIIVGIISLIVVLNYQRLKEAKWLNIPLEYVFLIQLLLSIPLLVVGTYHYNRIYAPSTLPVVQLDEYNQFCGPHLWSASSNMIQTQLNCLHYKDRVLSGDAHIEEVKIGGVLNSYISTLQKFPKSVRTALTCLMGETEPYCGQLKDEKTCQFKGCHFDSSNQYLINISTVLSFKDNHTIPARLTTLVSHKDIANCSLLKLTRGNVVYFNASLVNGQGSNYLILQVLALKANNGIEYSTVTGENLEETKQAILSKTFQSFQATVSFVLEILIGYSPSEYYEPHYF